MHSRQQHMCSESFVSLPNRLGDVSVGLVLIHVMWVCACVQCARMCVCTWMANINMKCLLGCFSTLLETGSLTKPGSHLIQPGCLVSELQGIHLSPPLVPTTGVSEMYYHGGFIMWMLGQIHFSANDYAANTLLTEPSPQPQTFGVLFG